MVSSAPHLTDIESLLKVRRNCQGCAEAASVVYEEVALCGSCFYIASLTSLRRINNLPAADGGTVADTASIISRLVQLFRNGFRPVAEVNVQQEDDADGGPERDGG